MLGRAVIDKTTMNRAEVLRLVDGMFGILVA